MFFGVFYVFGDKISIRNPSKLCNTKSQVCEIN